MISKFSIRNFKSCRDVQIELERFTVFVGPNGSGKSSILQAMDFLCRAFRTELDLDENEIVQNVSRRTNDQVELKCEIDGKGYEYRTREPRRRPIQFEDTPDGRRPLPLSVLLRLETSKLVEPYPIDDPTVMASNGSGVHAALANMALNEPLSWQDLQADLRELIPTVSRLRHTKANQNPPRALLFDTVGGDSLTADQVSEGTLLVLGLLTALHSAGQRTVVLLDDLDRGLHPKAQKELISFLRKLLAAKPDLQLLATTHSPYMLDSMDASEVRMTFLREDGTTVCGALAEHPEFERWKDEMTPGEMWSLFGEKWISESSPENVQLVPPAADEQEST